MYSYSEYLEKLWIHAPLSWAIIRTQEVLLLSHEKFSRPILEVGCGDGLVSQQIFNGRKNSIDVGIDLDSKELTRARKTKIYEKLMSVDITKTNFASGSFSTVLANGVLEHIPALDSALKEIARLLRTGGRLYTTSPTANFTQMLLGVRLLKKLGLTAAAERYGNEINNFFAHYHLYNHSRWQQLLHQAGLRLEKYVYYNNSAVITLHEITLPLALMTKFLKKFTNSPVLFPDHRRFFVKRLVKTVSGVTDKTTPGTPKSASIFLVAVKK